MNTHNSTNISPLGDYKGKRLLDLGCGPTIQSVISASKWYDEIVLSEYVEDIREEHVGTVQKWINGEPGLSNWNEYFQRFAQFEGLVQMDPSLYHDSGHDQELS